MATTKTTQPFSRRLRGIAFMAIFATVLLIVANSALWVNRTIFNTENFTTISTTALLSESSRQALGDEIVGRALADQPAIRSAVSDPASNFVAGLLNTQQARSVLTKLVSSVQILLTSKNPKNIEYDLTGIKTTVAKLIQITGKEDAAVAKLTIPDKIVIFDASKIPPFYKYGLTLTLIAPLAIIAALTLLAIPHIKKSYPTAKVLMIQGVTLIAGGAFALLIGPIFRPPVLAQVANANLRIVVENFYNAFIDTFNAQTMWLIWVGIIAVLIPLIARVYKLIRTTYFDTKSATKSKA